MNVIFHRLVRRDLREILEHYDNRSDRAGDMLFDDFGAAIRKIKQGPARFHPLDDLRRRCNLAKFPYHLVFEINDGTILITVLRHNNRRPEFGLRRRWD